MTVREGITKVMVKRQEKKIQNLINSKSPKSFIKLSMQVLDKIKEGEIKPNGSFKYHHELDMNVILFKKERIKTGWEQKENTVFIFEIENCRKVYFDVFNNKIVMSIQSL